MTFHRLPPIPRSLHALVVVDTDADYDQMCLMLAQVVAHDVTVSRAASHGTALERLLHAAFDVLLIDSTVSTSSGADLVRKARQHGVVAPAILLIDPQRPPLNIDVDVYGAVEVIYRRDLTPALLDRSIRHSMTQVHAAKAVRSIGAFAHSVLDALESHILVLDANGTVCEVNRAWRAFVATNGLSLPDNGLGAQYTDTCHAAFDVDEHNADALTSALRAMLNGEIDTHTFECVSRPPAQDATEAPECWYSITLSRLAGSEPAQVVASHEDVTERRLEHAARRLAETQYRSLVEHAPVVTFTESLDGNLTYISPQIEAITGYSASAWLGDDAFRMQVIHADDWDAFQAVKAVSDAAGTPFAVEYRIIRHDGGTVWVRDQAALMRGVDDQPLFWQGFLTDITAQREAQAELVARDARFSALVRNVLDLVTIIGADGIPTYESPAVERLLGYTDMDSMPLSKRVHPDDQAAVRALLQRVSARPGLSDALDFRAMHHNGSVLTLSATVINMLDEPAVNGIVLSARDITERVRMERERVEVENRYRTLIEQMPAMVDIGAVNLTSTPNYVSPQVLDLYGYTPEAWLEDGTLWLSSIHPDDVQRVTQEHVRTNATGERSSLDYRIITRSGETKHIRDEAFLVYSADGEPLYWQGITYDITDRTFTARALASLNIEYQQLVERAQDGIVAADKDGRITVANAAFCDMVGRPAHEVIGTLAAEFIHPDDLEAVQRLTNHARDRSQGLVRYEHRLLRDDGAARTVDVKLSARITDGIVVGTQAILRDNTDRVATETALRQSERRLRDVIENIPAVTYTYTYNVDGGMDTTTIDFSPRIRQVLGTRPEQVNSWATWGALIHPDDRAYVDAEAARTDRSGEPYDITYRVRTADGEWRWVHDVAVRTQHAEGGPDVWQGFFFDITKQMVLEERTSLTLRGALDAIITITGDGTVVDWNPAATSIFGYEQDDVIGRNIDELIIPERYRDAHRTGLRRLTETGEERILGRRQELTATLANGHEIPIELSITRISSDGHPLFTAFLRDISERRRAEVTIAEAEERYRTLVEQIAGAVYLHSHDPAAPWIYMSPQITDITGYDVGEWDRNPGFWATIVHPDDLTGVYQDALETLRTTNSATVEYRIVRADGGIIWVRDMAARVPGASGANEMWQGLVVDITNEKQSELLVRESEARYATLIQNVPNSVIMLFDHQLRYLLADGPAMDAFGIGERDIIGRTLQESMSPQAYAQLHPHYLAAIQGHGNQLEMVIRGRDALIDIVPVHGHDGEIMAGMVMAVDITERKRLEREITHQALHDSLTGLPNRALMLDRLDQALALARRRDLTVAALFIDIDDFKVVNDTMGHASGDHLLQVVADRFRTCLHAEDAVTRFGGDEFVVVLSDVAGPSGALEVANRLLGSLQLPTVLGGQELHLSCSIGIALSESGRVDRSDLLRHADIALYRVKAAGKHGVELFDHGMHESAVARLELERDLRGALSRGEFHLVFQPIVELSDGSPTAVEALLRWTHPVRGPISPVDFIPIAEATGQIVEIGEWVMLQACQQLARWRTESGSSGPTRMNVNLSARQFRRADLTERIRAVLTTFNLPPEMFAIELTESDVMADPADTITCLREIKQLGVKIAIDDFGTGYSSLAYLHQFPADVIKIDRTFIQRIGGSPDGTPIVSAMIVLAHTLGLQVVAEGIETIEQLEVLRELGCDRGQGFYFSRPLIASAIQWDGADLRHPR